MRLVAHFGVPTLPSLLAFSADDAVRAAERLGYPVVLKVHSAAVLHKTDSGGVRLDLRRPEEVRDAFAAIVARHAGVTPGVRVTPFVRSGLEVLVGAQRDPELGPLLLVGAGGSWPRRWRQSPCGAFPARWVSDATCSTSRVSHASWDACGAGLPPIPKGSWVRWTASRDS